MTEPAQSDGPGSFSRVVDADGGPTPAREFTILDLFFGSDGLRPIWGVLLFLGLREALRYVLFPLFRWLFPGTHGGGDEIAPHSLLVSETAALLCVLIPTWIMGLLERRPASAYGYGPLNRLRNFSAGLAWGAALLSLLILILRAAGLLVFDARLLRGGTVLHYALVWLAGFLLVALAEEVFNRGYLQFALTRLFGNLYRWLFSESRANALGFWTAALTLSFYFGFSHRTNPGESPVGMFSAGLIGMAFCLSIWRTGSLWWAIGFHAAWDWAQSFLYGVADSGLIIQGRLFATHPVGRPVLSGGLTGPEGSVFILPIVALAAVIIQLTLPRTHCGYTPANQQDASY